MAKYEDKNEKCASEDANHERAARREQFITELVHEFTNVVTAVAGHCELALHEIEDSHAARGWLEQTRSHTKQLPLRLLKLTTVNKKIGDE